MNKRSKILKREKYQAPKIKIKPFKAEVLLDWDFRRHGGENLLASHISGW